MKNYWVWVGNKIDVFKWVATSYFHKHKYKLHTSTFVLWGVTLVWLFSVVNSRKGTNALINPPKAQFTNLEGVSSLLTIALLFCDSELLVGACVFWCVINLYPPPKQSQLLILIHSVPFTSFVSINILYSTVSCHAQ